MSFSIELSQSVNSFLDAHAEGTATELSMPLMLMLVIVKAGGPIDLDKLAMEAMRAFPAFSRKMLARVSTLSSLGPIVDLKLMETLRSYEHGFIRVNATAYNDKIKYTITEHGARFILRRLDRHPAELTPPTGKICHFRDLPAELRLRILEFVLLLPNSGVWVGRKQPFNLKSKRVLQMVFRDPAPRCSVLEWEKHYLDNPRSPDSWLSLQLPLEPLLNLLTVSRTFKTECEGIFYGKNLFRAWHLHDLARIIAGLAPGRAGLLRRIAFSLSTRDADCAGEVLGKLKSLGVTSISILVEKASWDRLARNPFLPLRDAPTHAGPGNLAPPIRVSRPATEARPAYILGMAELCSFGENAEILVEGDWEEFAVYVRRNSYVKKVTFNGATVNKT